ncbi:MAG: hypothetical protein ACE5FU_00015 [Nitrospinota bacterium]
MLPFRKIVVFTFFLVSLFFALLFSLNRFEPLLMTGDLSVGHETLKRSCRKCHTPYENGFATCSGCHSDISDISLHQTEESISCIFCHTSHRGNFKDVGAKACVSGACHREITLVKGHPLAPDLCLKCHPEHKKERERSQGTSLKFSHRVHADPSLQKSFSQCISCHPYSFDEMRMEKPLVMRQCKKCHSEIIEEHEKTKPLFGPKCAWCHYSKKRDVQGPGRTERLNIVEFSHGVHFSIPCTMCHYRMEDFNTLDEIRIFPAGKKFLFCSRCHPYVSPAAWGDDTSPR